MSNYRITTENGGHLIEQEDIRRRQSAKKYWYQLGDRNTRYFHLCASQIKRSDQIKDFISFKRRASINLKGISWALQGYLIDPQGLHNMLF